MSETLFPLGEPEAKTEPSPAKGKPQLVLPNRTQIELRPVDLEGLLPADHMARAVWVATSAPELESHLSGKLKEVRQEPMPYDVFLSHAGADKSAVERLATKRRFLGRYTPEWGSPADSSKARNPACRK